MVFQLGVVFTDGDQGEIHKRFSLRYLRDLGFGRRYASIEALGVEEIQDILDVLHGRREDKVNIILKCILYEGTSIYFLSFLCIYVGQSLSFN